MLWRFERRGAKNRTSPAVSSLIGFARKIAREKSGQAAVVFALSTLPTLILVGAAVDYGQSISTRVTLQGVLDQAVLAGATQNTGKDATAGAIFDAATSSMSDATFTRSFSSNGSSYTGNATATVRTGVMQIVGFSTMTVTATATAQGSPGGGWGAGSAKGLCIVALNGSAQHALTLSGSASISASTCKTQVNSTNSDGVDLSATSTITAAENCFVGGWKASGSGAISPAPDASCPSMADPFGSYTKPTVGACDHNNYQSSGGSVTLYPGVYCGGISNSGSAMTLNPGLYIINGGQLKTSGAATMTGTGVTFFLTGNQAGVTASSSGVWRLSAMTTGSLAGFVFFLDPADTSPNQKSDFSGSSQLYFEGVVYLPKQQINLSGSAVNFTPAPFTSYIGDTIVLSGSSALKINSDPSQTSLPIPSALVITPPSPLRLTQ